MSEAWTYRCNYDEMALQNQLNPVCDFNSGGFSGISTCHLRQLDFDNYVQCKSGIIYSYGGAVQESQSSMEAMLYPLNMIGRAKSDWCVLNPFLYNAGNRHLEQRLWNEFQW